jgi:hypothetical protein
MGRTFLEPWHDLEFTEFCVAPHLHYTGIDFW